MNAKGIFRNFLKKFIRRIIAEGVHSTFAVKFVAMLTS